MKFLTIDELKKQCNIDEQYDGDNEYLEMVADAAEDYLSAYIRCPLEEVEGKNVACTHREIENEDEETRTRLEDAEYIFYVDYLENKISIKWIIDGDKLFTRDFEVDFYDRKETKNAFHLKRKHLN